tara:strand:+ start:7392 stop:8537 length:1146 start_codon:yes stop_codon:yes gene_type:complete
MFENWTNTPLSKLLIQKSESVEVKPETDYKQVTVKVKHRGVTMRQIIKGIDIGSSQYLANKGDFIISKIDARNGSMGLIPEELDNSIVTGDFPLFQFTERLNPIFFNYYTSLPVFDAACQQASAGSTNRRRLKMEVFKKIEIPLPPIEEQNRIVKKLELVKNNSDEIRKTRNQQAKDIANLLYSKYLEIIADAPWEKMETIAPITRRPVDIELNQEYKELGIRSFGKGTFIKPNFHGRDLTWQKPYWLKKDDLVISNIKAWEGAIAVVSEEEDGYVGSHRYITCVPDPKRLTSQFLLYSLLSPKGMEDIGHASPGSADRNRTTAVKRLNKIEVPVPSIAQQKEFAKLQNQLMALKLEHQKTVEDLDHLFPALLDKAFKGEL